MGMKIVKEVSKTQRDRRQLQADAEENKQALAAMAMQLAMLQAKLAGGVK